MKFDPMAELAQAQAEAAAYRWAYGYLQDRMESLGRNGWAHDCDGEIEYRIRNRVIDRPSQAELLAETQAPVMAKLPHGDPT